MSKKVKDLFGWVSKMGSSKEKKWRNTQTQGTITVGGLTLENTAGTAGTAGTGSVANEFKPLPVIGHLSLRSQYGVGLSLLAVNVVFAAGCAVYYYDGLSKVSSALTVSSELQMESQRIAKITNKALSGDAPTFKVLQDSKVSFNDRLGQINSASQGWDESQSLELAKNIKAISKEWRRTSRQVDEIVKNKDAIIDNAKNAKEVLLQSRGMVDNFEGLLAVMHQSGASTREVALLNYGIFLSQRIAQSASTLSEKETIDNSLVKKLETDVAQLTQIVVELDGISYGKGLGAEERKQEAGLYVNVLVEDAKKYFDVFKQNLAKLTQASESSAALKEGSAVLYEKSDVITGLLNGISNDYKEKQKQVELRSYVAGLFGILGVLSFGLIVLVNLNDTKRQAAQSKQEKLATDAAIMRLLDEMGDLADGDLTVRATVTEEVTGAIADSVNYAISQLAELVNNIQRASTQIQEATARAKASSNRLLKINEQQAKDIADTGRAVLQIAEAIESISKRMEDSKRVAEQSVNNANKGSEAMFNSMDGINNIKMNVDETGKRIRRLTEQSQQISEIVELIADISERTSVLAINATVQATKAGAAGKGFKVVADAVQDLANQASDATRKIGALISAIQTDILGAGFAMEKTTEEALKGAQLAEATGEALAEISDVSMALSDIVAEINDQVGQSAKVAAQVSKTMKNVLDSVNESSNTTKETDAAIEEVNVLAEKLRESVAGFKI